MKKRVVVTGMGAITPIGNSVEAFWEGVCQEKIGFDRITYFDTADYKCKLAAEVKDFNAADYMDKKAARRMEAFCQFAVAAAMTNAVKDAGAALTDITYINAHGTATHHNDLFETRAIKLAFGSHAKDIKINSTKSMVGHLLGAAGAIEFITCVKELECGFIHKTVGLMESEEELDLNYCKESYQEDITYALSNSLGFGGHNASILLKKFA